MRNFVVVQARLACPGSFLVVGCDSLFGYTFLHDRTTCWLVSLIL